MNSQYIDDSNVYMLTSSIQPEKQIYSPKLNGTWLFWIKNNPIELYMMWFLIITFIILVLCLSITDASDRDETLRSV
jgi:hypothetical protein